MPPQTQRLRWLGQVSSLPLSLRTKPPFSGPLLPTLLAEPFRRRRAALDTKEKGSAEEGEEDESVHAFVSRRLSEEVCGALEEVRE